MKATQTGILWSQVQVLVGPPEMKIPTFGLVFFIYRLLLVLVMSRNSKKRRDTKKKIKSQNLKKNWSAGGNLAVIAPTFTRVSNPFEGM